MIIEDPVCGEEVFNKYIRMTSESHCAVYSCFDRSQLRPACTPTPVRKEVSLIECWNGVRRLVPQSCLPVDVPVVSGWKHRKSDVDLPGAIVIGKADVSSNENSFEL